MRMRASTPSRFRLLTQGAAIALACRIRQQDLELHRLAGFLVHQAAVLDHPAGFLQQLKGVAQVFPVVAGAVGCRRMIFLGEHLLGQLVAIGLEQGQLLPGRQPRGRQIRLAVEVAVDALVGIVHEVLVDPLEVEGVAQRLAHPRILELAVAKVEDVALHPRGRPDRQLLLDDQVAR